MRPPARLRGDSGGGGRGRGGLICLHAQRAGASLQGGPARAKRTSHASPRKPPEAPGPEDGAEGMDGRFRAKGWHCEGHIAPAPRLSRASGNSLAPAPRRPSEDSGVVAGGVPRQAQPGEGRFPGAGPPPLLRLRPFLRGKTGCPAKEKRNQPEGLPSLLTAAPER